MHPLLAPIETLTESEIEHYRLIRRHLEIAFKQAMEGLVTPYDNDDRHPTLSAKAQRELLSQLAAELGIIYRRASDELIQSCETFSSYQREVESVLTRCLELGNSTWTSAMEGIIVEPVESTDSGDLTHLQSEVRSIVTAKLKPHVLNAAKAAMDQCAARLHAGNGEGALAVRQANVEAQHQEPWSGRTPAEILQSFVNLSEECGSIEELARLAKVAKATVYRVMMGRAGPTTRPTRRLLRW